MEPFFTTLFLLGAALLVGLGVASWAGWGRSGARRVRVAVDDLATGRLPPICAKTGRSPDLWAEVESSEGRFQPWWLLLLFLGPLGIVAIAMLWAIARPPARVGGQIPVARSVLDEYNRVAEVGRIFFFVGAGGAGLAVLAVMATGAWGSLPGLLVVALAVTLIGLAGSAATQVIARTRWVDVELDGSGRWAVLIGVHPGFAAAVQARYHDERAPAWP